MSEWKEIEIGNLCDILSSKRIFASDYVDEGVPFYRSKEIIDKALGQFSGNELFISKERYNKIKSRFGAPKKGDLLISAVGNRSGIPYCVKEEFDFYFKDGNLIWFKNFGKNLNSKYLEYYLSSKIGQNKIESVMIGSAQKALTISGIKGLKITIPPLSEQKAISHILGTLDDKIELNRQINQTLEAMAQALFKSWFVDFDPVIDNAIQADPDSYQENIPEELQARAEKRRSIIAPARRGGSDEGARQSHHSVSKRLIDTNPTLAALFPSSFVFNETLGKWIPEGWEVKKIGSELDVLETGRRPPGGVAKYLSGIPSVGAESIKGVGAFEYSKVKYVPSSFFEKMSAGKVEDYDVLLYKDGGKPGEFKPRIGMYGQGFPYDIFGINEHVFRIRSNSLGQFFLYCQLGSDKSFNDLAVMGGKAAIPGVNQQEVKSLDFLIPSKNILNNFNEQIEKLFTSILKKSKETQTLSQLRDTLLPQLISGKIRVSEGERRNF